MIELKDIVGKRLNMDSSVLLPQIPDKSVQMILTDPMYNLKQGEKEWYHEQFRRICFGTIAVFMPPENPWIPADQYLFWVKPISTKNTSRNYSRFVEQIFIYNMEKPVWNWDRHWSQYTNVFTDLVDTTSIHPYRKPPSMIERLIKNHTPVHGLVLDPFAGSFVVAEVCDRIKRDWICNDISKEEDYAYL